MDSPDSPLSTLNGPANLGTAGGQMAYVVGLALVLVTARAGFLSGDVWNRLGTEAADVLLIHLAGHAPVWNGRLHPELLPLTAVLALLIGTVGFLVARRSDATDVEAATARAVVVGYLPAAAVVAGVLAYTEESVQWATMVAPALLAGVVFPAACSWLGATTASRLGGDDSAEVG